MHEIIIYEFISHGSKKNFDYIEKSTEINKKRFLI